MAHFKMLIFSNHLDILNLYGHGIVMNRIIMFDHALIGLP